MIASFIDFSLHPASHCLPFPPDFWNLTLGGKELARHSLPKEVLCKANSPQHWDLLAWLGAEVWQAGGLCGAPKGPLGGWLKILSKCLLEADLGHILAM